MGESVCRDCEILSGRFYFYEQNNYEMINISTSSLYAETTARRGVLLAICDVLFVSFLREITFFKTLLYCFSFTSVFLNLAHVIWKINRMKYDLYCRLAKLLLLEGKIHSLNALRLELAPR